MISEVEQRQENSIKEDQEKREIMDIQFDYDSHVIQKTDVAHFIEILNKHKGCSQKTISAKEDDFKKDSLQKYSLQMSQQDEQVIVRFNEKKIQKSIKRQDQSRKQIETLHLEIEKLQVELKSHQTFKKSIFEILQTNQSLLNKQKEFQAINKRQQKQISEVKMNILNERENYKKSHQAKVKMFNEKIKMLTLKCEKMTTEFEQLKNKNLCQEVNHPHKKCTVFEEKQHLLKNLKDQNKKLVDNFQQKCVQLRNLYKLLDLQAQEKEKLFQLQKDINAQTKSKAYIIDLLKRQDCEVKHLQKILSKLREFANNFKAFNQESQKLWVQDFYAILSEQLRKDNTFQNQGQ